MFKALKLYFFGCVEASNTSEIFLETSGKFRRFLEGLEHLEKPLANLSGFSILIRDIGYFRKFLKGLGYL